MVRAVPRPAALAWTEKLLAHADANTGQPLTQPQVAALMTIGDAVVAPNKSPRTHRYVVLRNNLKVLLVSDPAAPRAAAALSMAVGSNADYPRSPGLAHFLEHMLFMGSKKYPEINKFSSFLSEHGSSNAHLLFFLTYVYFVQVATHQHCFLADWMSIV